MLKTLPALPIDRMLPVLAMLKMLPLLAIERMLAELARLRMLLSRSAIAQPHNKASGQPALADR